MLIQADTHTHTIASTHAYSTVYEMAQAASQKGLKALAITDHTPASQDGPHIWHFHNLKRALPRQLCGVNLIFGAEASIIDYKGKLDFDDNECSKLEWIIASVHDAPAPVDGISDPTQLYLNVAENPFIDVIGHCANIRFTFDYEKCLKKLKEYEKLVEINENTILYKKTTDNYKEIIRICKKYEIPVVVNTDAHFMGVVGEVSASEKLLEEQNFPKKLIVNSDWDVLKEFINKKRGKIFE